MILYPKARGRNASFSYPNLAISDRTPQSTYCKQRVTNFHQDRYSTNLLHTLPKFRTVVVA